MRLLDEAPCGEEKVCLGSKKKGRAKAKVPGPGKLELAKNKKVKGKNKTADGVGEVKLPIRPTRKSKKELNKRGRTKVKVRIIYTPDGFEPNAKSKRVKLIKR